MSERPIIDPRRAPVSVRPIVSDAHLLHRLVEAQGWGLAAEGAHDELSKPDIRWHFVHDVSGSRELRAAEEFTQ
jgi:hypothetical protein